MGDRFEQGSHILFRSAKDGRLHGALPVTVVKDEPELQWKDDHELAAAVQVGYYDVEQAAAIRAEGERVVAERIEPWVSPFRDGWERWTADPSWPIPELPVGWDRL